eukprot:scaffold32736_cov48-Attheya_sp.AAC.4
MSDYRWMASCGCEEPMFVGGNESSGSSWGNPEEERSLRLASLYAKIKLALRFVKRLSRPSPSLAPLIVKKSFRPSSLCLVASVVHCPHNREYSLFILSLRYDFCLTYSSTSFSHIRFKVALAPSAGSSGRLGVGHSDRFSTANPTSFPYLYSRPTYPTIYLVIFAYMSDCLISEQS